MDTEGTRTAPSPSYTARLPQTAPGGPTAILPPLASQDSTGNPLPLRAGPNLRQISEFTAFFLKTDSPQPPRRSVFFKRVI